MSTQGPNSAATITGTGWTSPTSAATTNAVYATISIAALSFSNDLVFSGFGFSIPGGAIINGIQVDIVAHASATTSLDLFTTESGPAVQVTKVAGTRIGTIHSNNTSWGATDATFTLGSGSDLWGLTWTAADINSSGFGVAVSVENNHATLARVASIDSALITVTYTYSGAQMFQIF